MTKRSRLLHYSKDPFKGPVEDTPQLKERHHKPSGFWVTDDSEYNWAWWCRAEQWHVDCLSYASEIVLAPSAEILRISTVQELMEFTYRHTSLHSPDYAERTFIDWRPIAEKYDGIMIMPYQWECRFTAHWYYSWDVSSACIWNARAVERVIPIATEFPVELW